MQPDFDARGERQSDSDFAPGLDKKRAYSRPWVVGKLLVLVLMRFFNAILFFFAKCLCTQASASKTPAPGASAEEVDRIMLEKAEESLRKVQADIDRDIGGKS